MVILGQTGRGGKEAGDGAHAGDGADAGADAGAGYGAGPGAESRAPFGDGLRAPGAVTAAGASPGPKASNFECLKLEILEGRPLIPGSSISRPAKR